MENLIRTTENAFFRLLYGPLWFVIDSSDANQITGIVMCLLLIPGISVPAFKRKTWAFFLAISCFVVWILLGALSQMIDV
jgi:hypothetical protein